MAKIALLIGVSEYQTGLDPLSSAIKDVEAMQRVLQHPEMGGFDQVKRLPPNPNRQQMEEAIYELFANRKKEDLLLFYFSGHGVRDQHYNFYLATSETRKDSKGVIPPTAVAANYLQTQMTNSRSQREVIILDCCFSGAIAQGLTIKGEVDIKAELGGKGRAILTSSSSTQYSFEQEGSELSIYSRFLVEGIETGAADIDGDGSISADELHQYATGKVQEAAPAMTPQFYPVEEGYRIYLARSPQDDPKLKYRKAAQKYAKQGQFTLIGRRILNSRRIEWGLTQGEAGAIEADILRPYQEYRQKLQEYEQALREVIEKEGSLSDGTLQELKDYQELLGLRDEDIAPIETRIAPKSEPPSEDDKQVFEFDVVTVDAKGQEVKREKRQAQYFSEDLGNDITLDMVYIPGGKFLMGSPEGEGDGREKPQHEVTVPSFSMGKFQVTQAQWKAIASLPKVERDLNPEPAYFKGDKRPVECVSWYDAVEFCQRLSKATEKEYRLPSEAEWEYACRAIHSPLAKGGEGGSYPPFHFGETITGELANYNARETYASEPKGRYREETTPVGQFPPNAFGLYDMHGNVWEWCADDWHDNYEGAPKDGSAWLDKNDNRSQFTLLRGGSWDDNPVYCRSAYRFNYFWVRDGFDYLIGFRVVCAGGRTV